MAKNYELVRRIAVLGGRQDGTTKEINIVRWGVYGPQIDIRRWRNGEPNKGITLNEEEARRLLRTLTQELGEGSTCAACHRSPTEAQ